MRFWIKVLPVYLVLIILASLLHGQLSEAQARQSISKSAFDTGGPAAVQAEEARVPRQTYVARILEEKPRQISVPDGSNTNHQPATVGKEDEDEESESSSDSSSEESDQAATEVTTKTTSDRETSGKNNKILLATEAKIQETGRLLKSRKSEQGHNWYTFGNTNKQDRSITATNSKDSDEDIRKVKGVRDVRGDGGNSAVKNTGGSSGGSGSGGGGNKAESAASGTNSGGGFNNVNNAGGSSGVSSNKAGGSADAGGSNNGGVDSGGTRKKPYNVMKARPSHVVDPDGYNFFQFKPLSRFGWLWLSKAKLVGRSGLDVLRNDDLGDTDDVDPTSKYDWEFRRYDRACLYLEYKKQKTLTEIPAVNEDVKRIVDSQNEVIARRFLEWHFVGIEGHDAIALQDEGDKHPLYRTYKFLLLTMELFRDKICRNATSYALASAIFAPTGAITKALSINGGLESKLLPKVFVDEIFRLFLSLREATLTKNIPDYATSLDDEEIFQEILSKCQKEEPNINWYSHSCGDQILSGDQPNNFACTPLVDYDYNPPIFDPILDGMWHMFNSVHAYCFKYFNQVNPRLWHRYALIIANSFTVGMRQRWKASLTTPKFFTRLLGPDHEVHLETMNRCMFSTVLRSDVPAVLPRFDTLSPITFGMERMIHKDGAAR